MSVDLLFELGWKSVLCAGAVLLALRLLGRRSAAEQSLVAHLGLVALVLLPLGVLGLPEVEIAAPAAAVAYVPEAVELLEPSAAPATAAVRAGVDFGVLLVAVYVAVCAAALLVLAAAMFRLFRIRRRAEVITDARWLVALASAQRRLGVRNGTALLVSGELASPVSWGILRPTIIVDPAAAAEPGQAEAIVAHELAHVVRLDWLRLIAGRLAVALFWFNPLVWILARRSHQLAEEAADDAVLRADVPCADYAELLVRAVRHAHGPLLLAANGVAPGRSSLAKRVAHVLDGSRPRGAARLGWAVATLAGAAGLNLAVAAAEPVMVRGVGTGEAAGELAALGTPLADALARALRSGDWSARKAEGRTTFDAPLAVEPLIAALGDPRPEARRIALWGLSEMRPTVGARAAAPVSRLLDDPDASVRAEAARALGDFGAAEHADAVARLLKDADAGVRLQAAHALGDLQSPPTRAALDAARTDSDAGVRAKAVWALKRVEEAEIILRRHGG
jgi:beta-lactamase regulating signal transducer with metallopeptidase domain